MSVISTPAQPESTAQRPSGVVVHDRRVTVDGITTQYLEAGTGPTLLLLHGHEQSATSWRWVIPALARTHRVLALSLPGHGDTAPAAAPMPPAATCPVRRRLPRHPRRRAAAPRRALRRRRASPLRLALADPARIRTLTLVDSAGLGREVHPLLALDTLPIIGELAIMLSRMPGGDLGRTTHVHGDAVRPALAGARRVPHRAARPRTPPRPARGLHRDGPRPVRRHRATPDPARPTPHPDHAHPGHLGRLRLRAARPPGPGRGQPAAPRAAVGVPRLRAPAPRRAPRPVRRRAQRLAHRTPRPAVELTADAPLSSTRSRDPPWRPEPRTA